MHPSLEKKIIEHPVVLKVRELDRKGIQPYFLASDTSGWDEVAVIGRHCINLSTTSLPDRRDHVVRREEISVPS
jgi:hypothetical protein